MNTSRTTPVGSSYPPLTGGFKKVGQFSGPPSYSVRSDVYDGEGLQPNRTVLRLDWPTIGSRCKYRRVSKYADIYLTQ